MSKKILLLGGSFGQIPAIKEAKRRGLYTILCDYLPDNPGRKLADKFYLVSTTDKEKVLEVALENDIDCTLAFGSDPAVLTSSYIEEKLGNRIVNSTKSIELLTHKDLFRKFQKENHFNTPNFYVLTDQKKLPLERVNSLLPAVVKPVDSSATKGVTMIKKISELEYAVKHAFSFSRCGRIIIEEKVGGEIADLNGDGFVVDGELKFCELGDHLFTSIADPLKPSSTFFPSKLNQDQIQRVEAKVAKIIKKSGYKYGAVNIEARINAKNEIYIMEIGPRNGGNYIPSAIYQSTGFDMVKAIFDLLLHKDVTIPKKNKKPSIIFTLHSNTGGLFESFELHDDLKPFIVENQLFIQPGDLVKPYNEPGSALGALVFSFDSMSLANKCLEDLYQKIIGGIHLNTERVIK